MNTAAPSDRCPGFWFKRICALADRVEKAENQNDDLNAQVAALQTALDAAINMNIDVNAKVVRLTAALEEANEDAARLAKKYYAMNAYDYDVCIHCRSEAFLASDIVHDENCPIALHRARCAKLEGGESVKDSPKEEAKG